MTVGAALRRATAEMYRLSLRLIVLNAGLALALAVVALIANQLPLALLLAPTITGPLAAGLVYCTVKLVREDEFHLADAVDGVRLYWKRGLALGGLCGIGLFAALVALSFYTSASHRAWPFAALVVYLLAMYLLLLFVSWPLAVADPESPLRDAIRQAWLVLLRNPLRALSLGVVLLVINVLGAAAVLPLLTLTIAFSFLAVSHLVLPLPSTQEEVTV